MRHLREHHGLRDHGFFHPEKHYDMKSFCDRMLLLIFYWVFTFGEPPYYGNEFMRAFVPYVDREVLQRHSVRVAQVRVSLSEQHIL